MVIPLRSCLIATMLLPAGCGMFQSAESPPAAPACPAATVPACPAPRVVEKVIVREVPVAPEPPPPATHAGKLHLPIVGAVEYARIEPIGLVMEARVDTGAETTSVHAEDLRLVERDGKRYVYFSLLDENGRKYPLVRRLRRQVLIKRPDAEPERRLVVELWVTLGLNSALVEVTLSDREVFDYPLLVGRNYLTDLMIVDVSRHHTLGQPRPVETAPASTTP